MPSDHYIHRTLELVSSIHINFAIAQRELRHKRNRYVIGKTEDALREMVLGISFWQMQGIKYTRSL